jgi:hypothetical protein
MQHTNVFSARHTTADKAHEGKVQFYLLNKDVQATTQFKFLDAKLYVKRIRAKPAILLAHNETLNNAILGRYNMMSFEIKTFTFSSGGESLTVDNAVLDNVSKRLMFTMLRNTAYLSSMDSILYNFRRSDMNYFSIFVNGKHFPNGGLSLDMGHEKTSIMGYSTLFEGSVIHHSNSGLQITHDMYISGYFILLFDLTADRAASRANNCYPDNGVFV